MKPEIKKFAAFLSAAAFLFSLSACNVANDINKSAESTAIQTEPPADPFAAEETAADETEQSSSETVTEEVTEAVDEAATEDISEEITEEDTPEEEEDKVKLQPGPVLKTHMRFEGRHVYKDETQWLVQSGSSAEFTVTGTRAEITIAGDNSIFNKVYNRPRYAVFIDGELVRDKTIASPVETIILFEEKQLRTADVKVILLSEGILGAVGIKDISVLSGSSTSILPVPEKDLMVEFIGDSITCGYGVDAKSGEEAFSTENENFMHSYAYLAAEELDADYSTVCYSGYGVASGYSSGSRNEEETILTYYGIASRAEGYDEKWDFTQRPADVVFINLGTNDTTYVGKDNKERQDEFTEEYVKLLREARKNNPDAVIVCTVGLMGGGDTIYPLIQSAVKKMKDDRITCFLSPMHDTEKNGAGAGWHPSAKTQKEYSQIVAEEIRKALGL